MRVSSGQSRPQPGRAQPVPQAPVPTVRPSVCLSWMITGRVHHKPCRLIMERLVPAHSVP